ncbi:MAG: glycosyltransferase family 4 protein [Thermoanaerobaculia bacterium]
MRPVVLVTSFLIPHVGGSSGHFELLERELRRRGLLAGTMTGSMASPRLVTRAAAVLGRGAGWEWPRAKLLLRTVQQLARLVTKAGPASETLFHCHDPLASCAVLEVLRPGDVVVQTVHGPLSREVVDGGYRSGGAVARTLNALERRAFGRVDMLLPVDGGQAAILRDEFDVSSDRLRIIRNAVDVDEIVRLSGGEVRTASRKDTFVVPRRLVRKNGVEFAIRALAHEEAAAFNLVIAGNGPELKGLKRVARSSGVTGRVRFLGLVDHDRLLPMMKAACGVIVPSVPSGGVVEATSLAVLEAMAGGVPVIGSDIGGIAEIISSPDLGFLVRPGEPEAIARAMKAIHDLDEKARTGRIERAREHVRKEFGVARWMTAILGAYEAAQDGNGMSVGVRREFTRSVQGQRVPDSPL